MSLGSLSRPIRHTPTLISTLAPSSSRGHRPECLQLPNQENNSLFPPCPAARRTETADALEAAMVSPGEGHLDLAIGHPGTPGLWHPCLQSWMVSAANSWLPLSVRSSLLLHFHQLSPGIWMGMWNIPRLSKGELKGGGDRSIWKNPICMHNDLRPGKGWRTKQWSFL